MQAAKRKDAHLQDKIASAMRQVDIGQFSGWNDLDQLATRVEIQDLEVFESEIVVDGDTFIGPVNVYVVLHYGNEDGDAFPDSYPGSFRGHLSDGKPVIDDVTVDTSSFYQ